MERVVSPGQRYGTTEAPASKSEAHRQIICAALSDKASVIECNAMSEDILATISCMEALGAEIEIKDTDICTNAPTSPPSADEILPESGKQILREEFSDRLTLYCKESGSTLRFLLPVAGALGKKAVFIMEGRLHERPMEVFVNELEAHGMKIRKEGRELFSEGRLKPGKYTIPGNISSQYITGLLMALPMLDGDSVIEITGGTESRDYILMTEDVLKRSGIKFSVNENGDYEICGRQKYTFPDRAVTEGDWSGASFFLCM